MTNVTASLSFHRSTRLAHSPRLTRIDTIYIATHGSVSDAVARTDTVFLGNGWAR